MSLQESWARTASHLARAAEELRARGDLTTFDEYVEHNELELAADVLFELGDEHGDLPPTFWLALALAYENMQLEGKTKRCQFRVFEADHGFVEARLTLLPTSDGGRSLPVLTDDRPSWNIGNRTEAGEVEINDARISLEDCSVLEPGGTATARLHPLVLDASHRVAVGAQLPMHEGSRVLGLATVTRVALKFKSTGAGTKPVFLIDGDRFTDLEGFYGEVSKKLIPGANWGCNLDAFNDILRGGFGTPGGGFVLRWTNSQKSRAVLGYAETIRWLQQKKQRCHSQNVPSVEEDIKVAERGEGQTLFDVLVDIIRTHGPGGAEHDDRVDLELA